MQVVLIPQNLLHFMRIDCSSDTGFTVVHLVTIVVWCNIIDALLRSRTML